MISKHLRDNKATGLLLALGAFTLLTSANLKTAQAQDGGADAPPPPPPAAGGGNGGGGGGGGFGGGGMTPEQRAERQKQMEKARWDWVKQTFTASGLTDATLQDSVVTAMQSKEKSRAALQEQARSLASLLVNKDTKDEDIVAALKAYRAAVLADKAIYTDLLTDLEAKDHYTTNPRLETLLDVLGVLGDETAYLGGLGELFPDSPMAPRRGFGGRGGPGGQGGQGGGRRRGGQGGGGQGGGQGGGGGGDMPAG